MRRYENINIIAALGAVMEMNTEHYKSDFQYDIEKITEAAKHPNGENNYLLWLSRRNGTECCLEREVYLIESHGYVAWQYHANNHDGESLRAFAVEVTGMVGKDVKGNLYELDYRKHANEVKKKAMHVATVIANYTDGTELLLPYHEWDKNRDKYYHLHDELLKLRHEPEDKSILADILQEERKRRRKESRLSTFKIGIRAPGRKRVADHKLPGKPITDDDLELVVSAANIAGHMERAQKIALDSDRELANTCVEIVKKYNRQSKKGEQLDFYEYAQKQLDYKHR
jgi:hypothetical protein